MKREIHEKVGQNEEAGDDGDETNASVKFLRNGCLILDTHAKI